jgi:hypothetical protein
MSPVFDPFDALMDRLAALAVEAVQAPVAAVQAYWLSCLCPGLHTDPALHVSLDGVVQQAWHTLEEWARPVAPGALIHLLRTTDLLVASENPRLTQYQPVMWDDVGVYRGVSVSVLPRYWPYMADIEEQTSRIWQASCRLYGVRPAALQQVPEEVVRGAVLFDAGLYFACHEYFETLWGRAGDGASDFFQGLIQVAVALRHLESHNVRGASILLGYGRRHLQCYPAYYKGLQLGRFLAEVEVLQEYLHTLPELAGYQFDAVQMPRLLDDME